MVEPAVNKLIYNVISMKNIVLTTLFALSLTAGLIFDTKTVVAAPTGLPAGFTATQLIDYNMIAPTGVKVAPDGRIFVFDLFGGIKIFTEGSGFNPTPFGSIPVDATGDRGLLGAVFDTDFTNNPYVYIHYVGTDSKVRIGRFTASSSVGANFTILYTAPFASGYQHAGGGITMDQNGFIYFGIGDSGTPTNSQDLTTSHGKIHRINRDGSIPANPFVGQAGVPTSIYAYGVRNPFRLTFDPVTTSVYVGDVGFNTWEEINLIEAGKNYGWALQEGPCTSTCSFENPRYWYAHQFGTNNSNDASILMGPVYRGTLYPTTYQGQMFVSDYVQGFLRTINPTVATTSFNTLSTSNGTVIDMDVAPNGKLYFVTITSPRLYRLDYTASSSVNLPPVAAAYAATTTGAAPLSVTFSSNGSTDPEGTPLTYLWDFGDGSTSTTANPTKVYPNTGQYQARLTVSDGTAAIQSSILNITVGNAPTLTINAPLGTNTYRGGDIISYTASGTDTNGNPLASSSITTTIRLHHSDHSHPFAGPFVGDSGQVTTPVDGELSQNVWLRFSFEATGINGVKTIREVDVYPQLSQITVTTFPAGLNVILDGSNHVIPPTVQGVIGMNRQVAAPSPQVFGGKQYVFDYWSDGGARDHTFSFPTTTTTYTAYFKEATSSNYVNLVENGSFENNGTLPTNWFFSRWGTNNVTASLAPDVRTGVWSAKLDAAEYVSGDGRLFHTPVSITPNTVYSVQYYRKNNVPFKAVADVTLENNNHIYIWLGITQPTTAWTDQNWTFTAPANSKNVVVNLYLTSAGSMKIDDFSLFDPLVSTSTPVVPPPTPVATTTPVTLTLGVASTSLSLGASTTISWNATGTSPTCVASGGWTGVKSATGSEPISPATTTTYTLVCGNTLGTTTQSVTTTVAPPTIIVPPTITNLITNPSVEEHDAFDQPIGWSPRRWGTNDGIMEHTHGAAYDGTHTLTARITTFTSGEAGWISAVIPVTPQTIYNFSQWTQSTGPTKVLVEITTTSAGKKYIWLGRLPQTTTWTEFKKSFTTPSDAQSIRIGTYMTAAGSLAIDAIFLAAEYIPPPTLTLTAGTTTITSGESTVLSWDTTGNNLTCLASDGWSGTKTIAGNSIVSPSATTTYTITCTNNGGTVAQSVTINVLPAPIVVPPPPTPTAGNLISPNTEWTSNNPAGWIKGSWGNNTTDFSVATSGRTDLSVLRITISSHISGDAKWIFEPVAITASSTYTFRHWYKTDAPTQLVAEFTLADNSKSHRWLGNLSTQSAWTENVLTLIPPVDATKVTIHHVIKGNGTLEIDDLSLTAN